ncbi:YfmQ family protein [Priestia endophytica]|uniref:YfmQ family protein n=1 Tax=Priestia endophytica TaxID=135735 RepID=UPI000F538320
MIRPGFKITYSSDLNIISANKGIPFVFEGRKGKKPLTFCVYPYSDHVDVFKQNHKSTVLYRLLAEQLHEKAEN